MAGRLDALVRIAARRPPPAGAVILAYHDIVSDGVVPSEYAVRAGTFERHLRALREAGYAFVDLDDLVGMHGDGRPLDGLAAVTFDDALDGVHRHALPVLARMHVPATVFAVASSAGELPPWWPSSGPVMAPEALRELHEAGVRIGCHTATHRSLPTLHAGELEQEICCARSALEDVLGAAVDLFAYPFGDFDRAVVAMVERAGYRAAVTFHNGRVTHATDRLRLPRFTMGEHHGRLRLRYHLARPQSSWPPHESDIDGAWGSRSDT